MGERITRHKGISVLVAVKIWLDEHYRAAFTLFRKFSEYPSAHLNSRTTPLLRYT
jgi:hypothetical protein